jgi:hypothetical protein
MTTISPAERRGGTVTQPAPQRFDDIEIMIGGGQAPKIPAGASGRDADIVQLYSVDSGNPSQFRPGPVLVVGGAPPVPRSRSRQPVEHPARSDIGAAGVERITVRATGVRDGNPMLDAGAPGSRATPRGWRGAPCTQIRHQVWRGRLPGTGGWGGGERAGSLRRRHQVPAHGGLVTARWRRPGRGDRRRPDHGTIRTCGMTRAASIAPLTT